MLSYRHGFHAGNHADVFKHLVLTLLVRPLLNKEKPFFYLDTHAAAGRYDLGSAMARKNREYETGIGPLWKVKAAPEAVRDYFETVRAINSGDKLRFYPGSPRVVRHFLRPGDRMALSELHPNEVKVLGDEFAGDKQVKIHHLDGYQALKALLPPAERRGLVLIDPAFELRDERRRLLDAVKEAYRRWATGIFAVWYPIQDRATADDLLRRFKKSGIRNILAAEFKVLPDDEPLRLNGSGMIVINPPWRLDQQLNDLLPWLWEQLAIEKQGAWRVEWLVPE
ncbi:23S rRNA (adenine(2030)-N(6))-methyltransferase RlmJ [Methylocaldum sp.]|uniref:23S rRNA (adenine(2030)-N(6))-methyltransferase RlmJ n=1 Tax=Methylocaldum sp. TaxID=1969727 RepID=UPI002D67AB34|nr:23S rRNA (adenine(2030)-N(6))-methyltransferase RlmJ [Methylocaldum sp.]HYE36717.1 23S rRNA (adenine(2030)-N(6))-methyltransferase RlmJ [Methylocaldum sp.]